MSVGKQFCRMGRATTALVEISINMISELASYMQDWTLPPLDEKTACELLGLEI